MWVFNPATRTWDAPPSLAQSYSGVFGFAFNGTLFVGGGCNSCGTSSPDLGPMWVGYDPETGERTGDQFELEAVEFEAWALTGSVVMQTENGRFVYTPGSNPVLVPDNPEMTCALPVAFIGEIGHGSFAIGDQTYKVMGYRPDPPGYGTGVERYTP